MVTCPHCYNAFNELNRLNPSPYRNNALKENYIAVPKKNMFTRILLGFHHIMMRSAITDIVSAFFFLRGKLVNKMNQVNWGRFWYRSGDILGGLAFFILIAVPMAFLIKSVSVPSVIDFCYISSVHKKGVQTGEFFLYGNREWHNDLDLGKYNSLDAARGASESIGCKLGFK